MENTTSRIQSFVLRIWREQDSSADWRGWVLHAGTGETSHVRNLDELVAFIEHRTGALSAPDTPAPGLK